ncbi:MAG: hypothetical protein L0170_20295, partial [Acidobacteria bacterium]|nr:hypothetical protein [Acidobacteriota bacterium]
KFFGTLPGDVFRFFLLPFLIPIGPVIPTFPDGDGDGSHIELALVWPPGFEGLTIGLAAFWGNPACPAPGVGFTNAIDIVVESDVFGEIDDGIIESGWVVAVPSGPSDFFNNNFGTCPALADIAFLSIAVLDFVTAVPAYPTAGVSNAALAVDPTGATPDIAGPGLLALVAPFTFPSGTFATTSGLYVAAPVFVPGGLLGSFVHGWVEFPPGDPGLLLVGADTSSLPALGSFFSLDGYVTPAVPFAVGNWGIRVD